MVDHVSNENGYIKASHSKPQKRLVEQETHGNSKSKNNPSGITWLARYPLKKGQIASHGGPDGFVPLINIPLRSIKVSSMIHHNLP